jgi:chromosome segregation ATPase
MTTPTDKHRAAAGQKDRDALQRKLAEAQELNEWYDKRCQWYQSERDRLERGNATLQEWFTEASRDIKTLMQLLAEARNERDALQHRLDALRETALIACENIAAEWDSETAIAVVAMLQTAAAESAALDDGEGDEK